MRLGVCSRSNDVVEPLIKPQWYVNCKSMAQQALDAVMDDSSRRMEIIPKQYVAEWKRYPEMIQFFDIVFEIQFKRTIILMLSSILLHCLIRGLFDFCLHSDKPKLRNIDNFCY